MIAVMGNTKAHNVAHGDTVKETISLRLSPMMREKIDTLADGLRRNRSSLIEFAIEELLDMSPDEINKRIMRRASKSR